MIKNGRGRLYDFGPLEGFENRELGLKAAWLGELRERVYDQIEDLPADGLDYEGPNTALTIGRLVLHMAWAESRWLARITSTAISDDLQDALAPGSLEGFEHAPEASPPADRVIAICRRSWEQVSLPAMRSIKDMDAVWGEDGTTIRGVLGQLEWHWIYHSGQVGLLRFEWGSDYQWTSGSPMAPVSPAGPASPGAV